jgi:3-methylfumaryl-CoA hydratase
VIDLDCLRQWVGRKRSVQDALNPFPAQALAAALNREDAPSRGDPLPRLRHWLYFLGTPQASAAGIDGHLKVGEFLPPVPLVRRMWAGGHLESVLPLMIGVAATRRTVIRSVEAKSGKTGDLAFVTLDHELFVPSAAAIDHARDFLAAGEQALADGRGALEFNGRMIDPPVVARARESLRRAAVSHASLSLTPQVDSL